MVVVTSPSTKLNKVTIDSSTQQSLKRDNEDNDEEVETTTKKIKVLPAKHCNYFLPPDDKFPKDRELTKEDEAMAAKIGSYVSRKIDQQFELRQSMYLDLKSTKKPKETMFLYMKKDSDEVEFYDEEAYEEFFKDFENFDLVGTKYEHVRHMEYLDEIREKILEGEWDELQAESKGNITDDDLEQWRKDRTDWFSAYARVYMKNVEKCQTYCPFSDDEWAVYWFEKLGLPGTKHLRGFGGRIDNEHSDCKSSEKLDSENEEAPKHECSCTHCESYQGYSKRPYARITHSRHCVHFSKEGFCLMHWGLYEVREQIEHYFHKRGE